MRAAVSGRWRILAGAGVLACLGAVALLLLPPYLQNFRYQNALASLAKRGLEEARADSELVAEAVKEAQRLGLPVLEEDVRVRRAMGRLEITVLYVVPARLPLYSVDLHFRPRGRAP